MGERRESKREDEGAIRERRAAYVFPPVLRWLLPTDASPAIVCVRSISSAFHLARRAQVEESPAALEKDARLLRKWTPGIIGAVLGSIAVIAAGRDGIG